jgi:DinB superfamily
MPPITKIFNMSETPQQYKERIENYLGTMDPIEVLESTSARLEALVARLENQQRQLQGQWTAIEILAHLAESEIVYGYRIRKALNASGTAIEATDQNVWVENAGYLQKNPQLALSLFHTVRKANISFLKSLTAQQLEHFGIHSERGKESIAQMARMIAGHDINHLQQMEKLL